MNLLIPELRHGRGMVRPGSGLLRVLLIANLTADRQESMLRFAGMLRDGIPTADWEVAVIAPRAVFGKLARTGSGLEKWLSYLDKYLLFPIEVRRKLSALKSQSSASIIVHICDHSNAPYAAHTGSAPCLVTCHDLGAVRGALGEPTYCPASPTGKLLQRWILRSLARASRIVCDSTATRNDVRRLLGARCPATDVVLLGLNQEFARRPDRESKAIIARAAPQFHAERPFLLHVGSSLPRKNRDGVLRIFSKMKEQWPGTLVFAGAPLSPDLQQMAQELDVGERMTVFERPDTPLLQALYNSAFALLFPSRFEGFGWPIIEAQACGCPVVCSDCSSLPEVAGDGALIRPVEDESGFAGDLLALSEPAFRETMVERGLENLRRFDTGNMIERYLAIYRELAAAA